MKVMQARILWNEANMEVVGADGDGPVERRTVLGGAVLGRGLEARLDSFDTGPSKLKRRAVADFLREWSNAINPDTPPEV